MSNQLFSPLNLMAIAYVKIISSPSSSLCEFFSSSEFPHNFVLLFHSKEFCVLRRGVKS